MAPPEHTSAKQACYLSDVDDDYIVDEDDDSKADNDHSSSALCYVSHITAASIPREADCTTQASPENQK